MVDEEQIKSAGELMDRFLLKIEQNGASDLHLMPGLPPAMRVGGKLQPLEGEGVLEPNVMNMIILAKLNKEQRQKLSQAKELDTSFKSAARRYRANFFFAQGVVSCVMRLIREDIPSFEDLHLPEILGKLALLPRGLVLVTGPAGSGKSTTLAAMVGHMNKNVSRNVITIEDPIEYIHKSYNCIIRQREVGSDTLGFAEALKSSLRQDPNVILIGEMRDKESIELAIRAAETGHLVLATLHTKSAAGAIDRIIDVFPAENQAQIRTQLAGSLEAVVAQQLIPIKGDASGKRIAVLEIMLGTAPVKNLIREGKSQHLPNAIVTGRRDGMVLMDYALARYVNEGIIDREEALRRVEDAKIFEAQLQNLTRSGSGESTF